MASLSLTAMASEAKVSGKTPVDNLVKEQVCSVCEQDLFVYIHGTSTIFRWFAHKFMPSLFSAGTDNLLLDFKKDFHELSKLLLEPLCGFQGPSFYYQWSGRLGEKPWENAAYGLGDLLSAKLQKGTNLRKIYFFTHSHGGQVLRLFLERAIFPKAFTGAEMNVITLNMPLVSGGRTDFPDFIKSRLNFQTDYDGTRALGAFVMKKGNERADTFVQRGQNFTIPYKGLDPHNGFIKDPGSIRFIQHALEENFTLQSEETTS